MRGTNGYVTNLSRGPIPAKTSGWIPEGMELWAYHDARTDRWYCSWGQEDAEVYVSDVNGGPWVDDDTDIDTSGGGTNIITNTDVWGLDGTTGITALIDMYAVFYCEMDCQYQSIPAPSVRSAYFRLFKNGAVMTDTAARLTLENGIQFGIGGSFTKTTTCAADDVFTVRVTGQTNWDDSTDLVHIRFGARRLHLPPPP